MRTIIENTIVELDYTVRWSLIGQDTQLRLMVYWDNIFIEETLVVAYKDEIDYLVYPHSNPGSLGPTLNGHLALCDLARLYKEVPHWCAGQPKLVEYTDQRGLKKTVKPVKYFKSFGIPERLAKGLLEKHRNPLDVSIKLRVTSDIPSIYRMNSRNLGSCMQSDGGQHKYDWVSYLPSGIIPADVYPTDSPDHQIAYAMQGDILIARSLINTKEMTHSRIYPADETSPIHLAFKRALKAAGYSENWSATTDGMVLRRIDHNGRTIFPHIDSTVTIAGVSESHIFLEYGYSDDRPCCVYSKGCTDVGWIFNWLEDEEPTDEEMTEIELEKWEQI